MGRIWGYSSLAIGLGLLPGPVLSGMVTMYGGRIAERSGPEVLVRWGSMIPILAVTWPLFFLTEEPNYWLGAAPAIGLFGAGWALTQPPLNSAVLSQVDADVYGEVNAAFNTVRNIAGALGIAIAVAIIGDPDRPTPWPPTTGCSSSSPAPWWPAGRCCSSSTPEPTSPADRAVRSRARARAAGGSAGAPSPGSSAGQRR